jgi:hypothetical protein
MSDDIGDRRRNVVSADQKEARGSHGLKDRRMVQIERPRIKFRVTMFGKLGIRFHIQSSFYRAPALRLSLHRNADVVAGSSVLGCVLRKFGCRLDAGPDQVSGPGVKILYGVEWVATIGLAECRSASNHRKFSEVVD